MKSDALDARVNLMSAAFKRLSKVSAILTGVSVFRIICHPTPISNTAIVWQD